MSKPQDPNNGTLEDLARDRGQTTPSKGQPYKSIGDELEDFIQKLYETDDGTASKLNQSKVDVVFEEFQATLLAYNLALLPEKIELPEISLNNQPDDLIGYSTDWGFNKAITEMEQSLREGYGGAASEDTREE